jgi:hypothetical protein
MAYRSYAQGVAVLFAVRKVEIPGPFLGRATCVKLVGFSELREHKMQAQRRL